MSEGEDLNVQTKMTSFKTNTTDMDHSGRKQQGEHHTLDILEQNTFSTFSK